MLGEIQEEERISAREVLSPMVRFFLLTNDGLSPGSRL